MYTLNGCPLSPEMHQTLLDDSDLYRAQVESGHEGILMDIIPSSVMVTLLAFFEVKWFSMNKMQEQQKERQKKWNDVQTEMSLERIHQHLLIEPVSKSDIITFLLTLSIKDLYEFTEALNFMLSKSLTFAISTIVLLITKSNPRLFFGIVNYLEEKQKFNTELRRHEEDYIHWKLSSSNKDEPFTFRFTDGVWILLKIELFAYTVVMTAGCSFASTEMFGVLSRLEPKTPSEVQMMNYPRIVTKLEVMNDGKFLGEFYTFSLKECRMTYTNGIIYQGDVFFHPIAGPIRHGVGSCYDGETVIEGGTYIFDEMHKTFVEECECNLCNCLGVDEDEDDEYDSSKCYFHMDKEEVDIYLCDDTDHVNFFHCSQCSTALIPYERQFLESLLPYGVEGDKVVIKFISSYKDYVQYPMKYL